jgi:hypothetical protein
VTVTGSQKGLILERINIQPIVGYLLFTGSKSMEAVYEELDHKS